MVLRLDSTSIDFWPDAMFQCLPILVVLLSAELLVAASSVVALPRQLVHALDATKSWPMTESLGTCIVLWCDLAVARICSDAC